MTDTEQPFTPNLDDAVRAEVLRAEAGSGLYGTTAQSTLLRRADELGSAGQAAPFSDVEFSEAVAVERIRQVEKGYDAAHDRAHGATHVHMWAEDYARRGEVVKAAAMYRALVEVVRAEEREKAAHIADGFARVATERAEEKAARIIAVSIRAQGKEQS